MLLRELGAIAKDDGRSNTNWGGAASLGALGAAGYSGHQFLRREDHRSDQRTHQWGARRHASGMEMADRANHGLQASRARSKQEMNRVAAQNKRPIAGEGWEKHYEKLNRRLDESSARANHNYNKGRIRENKNLHAQHTQDYLGHLKGGEQSRLKGIKAGRKGRVGLGVATGLSALSLQQSMRGANKYQAHQEKKKALFNSNLNKADRRPEDYAGRALVGAGAAASLGGHAARQSGSRLFEEHHKGSWEPVDKPANYVKEEYKAPRRIRATGEDVYDAKKYWPNEPGAKRLRHGSKATKAGAGLIAAGAAAGAANVYRKRKAQRQVPNTF